MKISIPDEVQIIIDTLENAGYEAYAVGGCVRDAVLGHEPEDWDICTPALPKQVMQCFPGYHIIETGLKHGTITLFICNKPYEITTYRIDGIYSDNRHPDRVEFVNDLKEDLSRRDFTVNAMAYNPNKGFVDFFGGISDINNRTIRCVGDADKRFQEDALRIMRALRFASVLGFSIETETSYAIKRNKKLLMNIAVERISAELSKLLSGVNVDEVLLSYASVIEEVIPEIRDMIGFEQNTPYHYLDVWMHTVESIKNAPDDTALRLTMLLHDIAKPESYSEVDSIGHFYGHPQTSSDMAKEILSRLKYDNKTIEAVAQLILYHDTDVQPRRKHIKRWLSRIGEERFRQLLAVKRADAMAQSEKYRQEKLDTLDEILRVFKEIIEQQQCFSLKDLGISGRDLIALGVTEGVMVGKILNQLLDLIINESIENEREQLLNSAREMYVLQAHEEVEAVKDDPSMLISPEEFWQD